MLARALDRRLDRRRAGLRKVHALVGAPGSELGEPAREPRRRLRREVVGDVDDLVHLRAHRREHLRMPEAQVDALVRAAQVEDPAPVRRVDPAAVGKVDRDRRVVALRRPALHQVSRLERGEIVGHGFSSRRQGGCLAGL
jgi:hypothetical protein